MTEAHALHSLYGGAKARDAAAVLCGNVGRPAYDRDQEAWTPDEIVDLAREAMGSCTIPQTALETWRIAPERT